jgi:hypothetical protein
MKISALSLSALIIGVGLTNPTLYAGKQTFGSGNKVTKLKYGAGVYFRGGDPRKITMRGGSISVTGYDRYLAMKPLVVTAGGGSFVGNYSRFSFPATTISAGATLRLGDNVAMNLGNLFSDGALSIFGNVTEVSFSGTCAELSADLMTNQKHGSLGTHYWPEVTIGSGSSIGKMTVGRARVTFQGSASVDTLTLGSTMLVDCTNGTPLTIKKMIIGNRDGGVRPIIWGRPTLVAPFILVDHQGNEPIQVDEAVRLDIESRLVPLGDTGRSARYSFVGGDGNDLVLVPVAP